jgi:adenosylhomocysteinase
MKANTLKVPAINVNDSVTKSKNDNKYGCRHSLNDAVKRATDRLLTGRRALVVGYGDVGKGSAQSLRQEGMIVRVTEIDPICAMQACMDGYEVVSAWRNGVNTGRLEDVNTDLLGQIDLIVTCTGNDKVCDANMLRALKRGAVVCNIGHFDTEIDVAFMRANWRWQEVKEQVHQVFRSADANDFLLVLSEGRLVNLGNAMGHPSRVMDGSFCNQVLAQMHLFEHRWADQPKEQRAPITVEVLPKHLDEQVARLMVEGFGGVMTTLTPTQASYIGVKVEGPYKTDAYKY